MMYSDITVRGSAGELEAFNKGLAVQYNPNEVTVYPVNLSAEELGDLIVTLSGLTAQG